MSIDDKAAERVTRNVVQICAVPNGSLGGNTLFALCGDGTIWSRWSNTAWVQVHDVPQPWDAGASV